MQNPTLFTQAHHDTPPVLMPSIDDTFSSSMKFLYKAR
jgi:hypothetical protein